jgi:hypothetical protein
VSLFSFDLDPHKVLGVNPDATLGEIREAYRQKAKRYHPDAGGEDWSFRIVSQAYEMLSAARVARAVRAEPPAHPQPAARPHPEPGTETVHPGIYDRDVPPARILAVELLCVRYLWDQADYLWISQRAPDEERFLSCNLNMSWPDASVAGTDIAAGERTSIITALTGIFDHLIISSRAVSSRSRAQDDRFGGWLSYSNFDRAWKALDTLHQHTRSHGLGIRQWSRDLFIPRGWS